MRYFDHCYQMRYLTTATRDVVPFKLVSVPSASWPATNDDVRMIQRMVTIRHTDGFIIKNLIVNRLSISVSVEANRIFYIALDVYLQL